MHSFKRGAIILLPKGENVPFFEFPRKAGGPPLDIPLEKGKGAGPDRSLFEGDGRT